MTTASVLLFAPLGSDPSGAARSLLERCRDHPVAQRWWLTMIGDAQLRIEHALDLNKSDLALFLLDGGRDGDGDGGRDEDEGPAWEFRALHVDPEQPMPSSESDVTPTDVLHSLATLGRRASLPQCYALTVRRSGNPTEWDTAFDLLISLLEEPNAERWKALLP